MKADFILGVDPGLGGAIAVYDTRKILHPQHLVFDAPLKDGKLDPFALSTKIKTLEALLPCTIHGVIERVSSLPRQAGAFNFGLSTGIIHGVLAAHGIPFTLVSPSQWKPAMGLQRATPDEPQAATKTRARQLAAQLFPRLADQFKRVKDDGRAEALLLAVYFANKG